MALTEGRRDALDVRLLPGLFGHIAMSLPQEGNALSVCQTKQQYDITLPGGNRIFVFIWGETAFIGGLRTRMEGTSTMKTPEPTSERVTVYGIYYSHSHGLFTTDYRLK